MCRKITHAHKDSARGVAHATPAMPPAQRTNLRPLHPRGPTRSHRACVVAPSLAAVMEADIFTSRSPPELALTMYNSGRCAYNVSAVAAACLAPWTRVQRHRACGDRLPARGAQVGAIRPAYSAEHSHSSGF